MKAIFLADSKGNLPCGCESALLLPVVNRPVVWHQMNMLKDWGVTEIVFADEVLKPSLQKILAGGDRWGVKVRYATCENTFDEAEKWIVLAPGWVGMGILPESASQVDDDYVLEHCSESGDESGLWILTGHSLNTLWNKADPANLDEAEFARRIEVCELPLEKETSFLMTGDVTTADAFITTNLNALNGILPLMTADSTEISPGVFIGAGATIDPSAELEAPVLVGDGCIISAGARLKGAIIGDGTAIGRDCLVEDAVVGGDTFVGNMTEVTNGYAQKNCLQNRRSDECLLVEDPFLLSDITVPVDLSVRQIIKGLYDLAKDHLIHH